MGDVALCRPRRRGRDGGSVEARIGFGHAETDALFALDQWRQDALALRVRPEYHYGVGAEEIDVHGGSPGHARPGPRDAVGQERCLGDPESCAALRFGHGNTEPARLDDRRDECFRECSFRVAIAPVVRVKACAKCFHGRDDFFLCRAEFEVHGAYPCSGRSRCGGFPCPNVRL